MNVTEKPELPWSDHPVWVGIDCGRGWWPLIADLDRDLRAIYPDYKVVQVKEKFGSLRYYVESPPPALPAGVAQRFSDRLREAEALAAATCEECGQPGRPRDRSWIRTLCDEHAGVAP